MNYNNVIERKRDVIMKKLGILLITLSMILMGCGSSATTTVSFSNFIEGVFVDDMEESYTDCHFTLKNPSKYHITNKDISFGNLVEKTSTYTKKLKALEAYKNADLTSSQKITYTLYHQYLEDEITLSSSKYDYLNNVCDPLNSETSNVTTVLIEFPFYKQQDIKDYITLIKSTKDYCDQIVDYLKKQSAKGNFMPTHTAKDYIETLDAFLDKNDNPLVRAFKNYDLPFTLTSEQKADYIAQIKAAYDSSVYEGFKEIKTTVKSLEKSSNNQLGLYYLKNGKSYYEESVKSILGYDMSIDEIWSLMKSRASTYISDMQSITAAHPEAMNKVDSLTTGYTSYKKILAYLSSCIKTDFPEIKDVEYTVSAMDKSNAKDGNTAYYMVPPIDDNATNVIRVNTTSGSSKISSVETFTTLAHEGFPGHLYQYNYQRNVKRDNILSEINCNAYTEGYATYAQYKSYDYLKKDTSAVKLYRDNDKTIYALVVMCDIGIHYKGWNESKVDSFLQGYGLDYGDDLDSLYYQLLGSPAVFVSYHVGCALFEKYKAKAQSQLGSRFSELAFNKAILKNGNVSMSMVEEQVNDYIDSAN